MMKLFGEQLPKGYALGVGTDKWESYGDLVMIRKQDLVRKRIQEVREKLKDEIEAERAANELEDWWRRNKGKVVIYWRKAWENL